MSFQLTSPCRDTPDGMKADTEPLHRFAVVPSSPATGHRAIAPVTPRLPTLPISPYASPRGPAQRKISTVCGLAKPILLQSVCPKDHLAVLLTKDRWVLQFLVSCDRRWVT